MASTRISAQLSRLSIRQDARPGRCNKCLSTPLARSISTSTSSQATVSPIVATSPADFVPVKPLEEQTVLATIHQFPSLEPLRFKTYPANHLNLPTRKDILHRAVIYEGDRERGNLSADGVTRLSSANTKTRYEVRGSRRKVRPQKGSGNARLGNRMSPMLKGGGVAFGPKPRDFSSELPKKVYDLAWRTALSYRYRKGELIIVDNAIEIESPSTRLVQDIFDYHDRIRGRGRSLLVTTNKRPFLQEALKSMDRSSQTLTWDQVDVKNLLELSRIMIERDALRNILLCHKEDLTHTAFQPWQLIQSHPPNDLESITGWVEFRKLQLLDPQKQDSGRASAYKSVAAKRYKHASALGESSPQRADLTISAYNLTAEAHMLTFAQLTGMRWSDYASNAYDPTPSVDSITSHREEVLETSRLPAISVLEHRINKNEQLQLEEREIDPAAADKLEVERAYLEANKCKTLRKAAGLAAMVHENMAEARRLAGDEDEADMQLEIANMERSREDGCLFDEMQARLIAAERQVRQLKSRVARGVAQGEEYGAGHPLSKDLEGALAKVAYWEETVAAKQAEREAAIEEEYEGDEEGEEVEEGIEKQGAGTVHEASEAKGEKETAVVNESVVKDGKSGETRV